MGEQASCGPVGHLRSAGDTVQSVEIRKRECLPTSRATPTQAVVSNKSSILTPPPGPSSPSWLVNGAKLSCVCLLPSQPTWVAGRQTTDFHSDWHTRRKSTESGIPSDPLVGTLRRVACSSYSLVREGGPFVRLPAPG